MERTALVMRAALCRAAVCFRFRVVVVGIDHARIYFFWYICALSDRRMILGDKPVRFSSVQRLATDSPSAKVDRSSCTSLSWFT
jgi:hypothetical protein